MEKFIPYEKLSKKKQRELDLMKRGSWGGLTPVTRKPKKPRAYDRRKAQSWKKDSGSALYFCSDRTRFAQLFLHALLFLRLLPPQQPSVIQALPQPGAGELMPDEGAHFPHGRKLIGHGHPQVLRAALPVQAAQRRAGDHPQDFQQPVPRRGGASQTHDQKEAAPVQEGRSPRPGCAFFPGAAA